MIPTEIRVALVGAGIEESLSPALHEREAEALGIDYRYDLLDIDALGVDAAHVGRLIGAAQRGGLRGLNVTHPCKQLVVEHLDALTPQARRLGAVNTIVFDGTRRVGHNTDWPGFAEGFRRGLPGAELGHVVLVGAGGAGSAVAHAIAELGAERLTIVDEDGDRAAELAGALELADAADPPALERLLASADGIVHATPTGMAGHPGIAFDPELLDARLWVAEVVYRPLATELLQAARDRGCRTLDGGRMAVFQAYCAFE